YNNKELLNIISPFTTIVGIIITGYVAIYVMQKNHKFDIKNLKMEREIQDIRSQREVDYLLSEISIFAYGYGKKITKTLDIQKLTIEHIRKELLYIENSCKQIRNIKFYEINDRKIDNMHLIDEIMRNVKNADIDLIQKGFSVDANLLGEKFRKIYNLIYDHIETSEFVEFKDEKFN
ncbi:hypothetical protein, partial [Mammaliicoccus vitulinus]|uniref:hypothetical protein n=1 Tax=Mammaliicoccus vitulinus TaxID=71237 RepID=UPI001304B4C7